MKENKHNSFKKDPRSILRTEVNFDRFSVRGISDFVFYKASSMDFSFKYPKNWLLGELNGKSKDFKQILIQGPRNSEDSCTTSIRILRAVKGEKQPYSSLDNFIAVTKKRYSDNSQNDLKDEWLLVANLPARRLNFVYDTSFRMRKTETKKVTIRESDVFLEKNGILYEFSLLSDVKEYNSYQSVFETFLNSIVWTNEG